MTEVFCNHVCRSFGDRLFLLVDRGRHLDDEIYKNAMGRDMDSQLSQRNAPLTKVVGNHPKSGQFHDQKIGEAINCKVPEISLKMQQVLEDENEIIVKKRIFLMFNYLQNL